MNFKAILAQLQAALAEIDNKVSGVLAGLLKGRTERRESLNVVLSTSISATQSANGLARTTALGDLTVVDSVTGEAHVCGKAVKAQVEAIDAGVEALNKERQAAAAAFAALDAKLQAAQEGALKTREALCAIGKPEKK